MKVNSVKGTNDYLPKETKLRDYLQGRILETYGFSTQRFIFKRISQQRRKIFINNVETRTFCI